MASAEWIELAKGLAWPVVGLLALIYVWRSDAIGKLIKISDSVKDLNDRLKDLVDAEQRLSQSVGGIGEVTTTINDLQSDLLLMKADVESIRDKVDQPPDGTSENSEPTKSEKNKLDSLFSDIDGAWQAVTQELESKFGWFDRRSTGSEAYRFAHGNRKGPRLSYDLADEIARLHSSIKSYRRRHGSLAEWLTQDVRDEFVKACSLAIEAIKSV
jgi:uncharacterized phage infection (PIP) family protein YhgE